MNVDLTTTYLGMTLKNPLVASASPLTGDLEKLKRMEQAGASAVVLPSLFQETIEHEEAEIARLYEYESYASAESLTYLPEMQTYNVGPDHYMLHLREAKKSLSIPVIASLNGCDLGGWTRYAEQLQDAGADALELNIYFVPTDPTMAPDAIEARYVKFVQSVRESISIPLAVKIGPYFTNFAYTAKRLTDAGADGLVIFNRYLAPDINIDELQVEPRLMLSSRNELWLSLRWLAILHGSIDASLAATSGVHFTEDVIKSILAGADIVMMASVLLQRGPDFIATLLQELNHWLTEKGYESITQMKGSMNRNNSEDASTWERANYTKAIVSFSSQY